MAASTGIVLTAGTISFANDWLQTNRPNFRIVIATLGTALVFSGIEKVNRQAAVGLGVIMFITVMATPLHGKSPAETLISTLYGSDTTVKPFSPVRTGVGTDTANRVVQKG